MIIPTGYGNVLPLDDSTINLFSPQIQLFVFLLPIAQFESAHFLHNKINFFKTNVFSWSAFCANYQFFCVLTKPWSGLMSLSSELHHDPVSHFKQSILSHTSCQVTMFALTHVQRRGHFTLGLVILIIWYFMRGYKHFLLIHDIITLDCSGWEIKKYKWFFFM